MVSNILLKIKLDLRFFFLNLISFLYKFYVVALFKKIKLLMWYLKMPNNYF